MNDESASLIPGSAICNSNEPLWEWDVPTDALYWSQGSRPLLQMENPPDTMSAFYDLLQPDTAQDLLNMRLKALSSHAAANFAYDYLFNGIWISEILIVLFRDDAGAPVRVLGSIKVLPSLQEGDSFFLNSSVLDDIGSWVFHVPTGRVWRDKACRLILGISDTGIVPVSKESPLLDVHPAERIPLQRHYKLFCESTFLGDHITDMVHIKKKNGDYEPILVRASAIERDASGNALLVAGILGRDGSSITGFDIYGNKKTTGLGNIGNGHWTWDTTTENMDLGEDFLESLGYESIPGKDMSAFRMDLVNPDDRENLRQTRENVLAGLTKENAYECTYRMLKADGQWVWMFERGSVAWRDRDGRAGQIFGTITNITIAQEERHKLEELVCADALTGVHSRAYCMRELDRLEHRKIRPVSIISLDVDGLKMINDTLGHASGDALLGRVAAILKNTLRRSDFVGRMGGDEFLVILPGQKYSTAKKILEKIQTALENANREATEIPVYAACGLACAEDMALPLVATVAKADEDMYRNKKVAKEKVRQKISAWLFRKTGAKPPKDDRF